GIRRQSRWPLAAAACLALLFAGTTAWLWIDRVDQNARMAELLDQIEAQRRMSSEATEEAEQLRNEMGNMRERYALVTSPTVQVMPMRPVGDQPRARGMLFVGADRQHWYMTLEGLEPAGAGAVYQLWWVTDQGILSGGSFTAESSEKIQMSADEMPSGTRQAIVTFEPAGIVPAPTGPQVLRAGP
ncbi:MAG TPA: anti-sigma factor, partial [Thermoanaerobaculia bacterium]|nr:anti-sigma factor [Thermoanaerobaculia bacterium]